MSCEDANMSKIDILKDVFWKNKILSENEKEKVFYFVKSIVQGKTRGISNDGKSIYKYIEQILKISTLDNSFSRDSAIENKINYRNNMPKLLAYYLPQYYPTEYNDKWWGKGSTEWTNVSKAMPQYLGQYQPRLPGELGFYDLRIQENIYRQIELAKAYGIYGFCFYYYFFDNIRLLDLPFNNFVNDKNIYFPFCICWVNESWTKQWYGTSNTILMEMPKSEKSYKNFIKSCCELFVKENYIKINNKPVLIIYSPYNIPKRENILEYWREYVKKYINKELYIIASNANTDVINSDDENITGFDALSEFAPGAQLKYMNDITRTKKFVCKKFYGKVYDYKEFVENKKYFNINNYKRYRAIAPMWDNTARKINKGVILDGATPELYKKWLKDIIVETNRNESLDDNIIFINAWNEWAEGAYLEPDLWWKYGYLEATREAIIETMEAGDFL